MFTLQQLKYALEVADRGSISEASRRLFITQPALSNSIRELEDMLGITIFTRTKKGITLTGEGSEFLAQARQLVLQCQLVADKYEKGKADRKYFRVSTQHYTFATEAFVSLLKRYGQSEFEFSLHETRTFEVIEDVRNLVSEVGILYISDFNSRVINKILKENDLAFKALFTALPHVFVGSRHPLAKKDRLTLEELENYPYVFFEQGAYNSLYFSEEHVASVSSKKLIKVNDRAALLNILIGSDAFTVSTGIMSVELNGDGFAAVALEDQGEIELGVITHRKTVLSPIAETYLEILESVAREVRVMKQPFK